MCAHHASVYATRAKALRYAHRGARKVLRAEAALVARQCPRCCEAS